MLMAHQVSAQYFSRQIESEADLKGLQLLQKRNIDTKGMLSFFKKMQSELGDKKELGNKKELNDKPELSNKVEKNSKQDTANDTKKNGKKDQKEKKSTSSDVSTWFSSHPDTRNRIQAIEQYLASHPCPSCRSLSWDKPLIMEDLKQQRSKKRSNEAEDSDT